MFNFLHTIFTQITSAITTVVIAVGSVFIPTTPEEPLAIPNEIQTEIVTQETLPESRKEDVQKQEEIERLKKEVENLKKAQAVPTPVKSPAIVQPQPPVQSNLPSQQAMEITLTKMLRQQCYDTYPTEAQIQINIDKISGNQAQKARERQELIARQEKEIEDIRNATDSYSVRRRVAGNEEDYINFKRELQQQRLDSFDIYWDSLHPIIGIINLSKSREEMCNF